MDTTHRLGLVGNWALQEAPLRNASDHGFSVRKTPGIGNASFLIVPSDPAVKIENILPPGTAFKDAYSTRDVSGILAFLYQPFAAAASGRHDVETARSRLHAAIRYASSGSVMALEKDDDHDEHAHHNHHDGCEDVADDMLEKAALQSDSEANGALFPGFKFDKTKGLFVLALDHNVAHRHVTIESGDALVQAIWQTYNKAKGNPPDATPHLHKMSFTAKELAAFSQGLLDFFEENPELVDAIEQEEKSEKLRNSIEARSHDILHSTAFQALVTLKPDYALSTEQRLIALHGACAIMAGLIDNPEMRRIWKKFKITQGNEAKGIEEFAGRLMDLREAAGNMLSVGAVALEDSEALTAEFRDIIAASRHFITALEHSIDKTNGRSPDLEAQRQHLKELDNIFKNSSIAPIALSRDHLEGGSWDVSHYVTRHTGVEGINYGRAFREFIDDFGGEVIEFIQKNPALTAASVLALYMTMNAGGGGNQALVMAPEFAGPTAIDPDTGLPIASQNAIETAVRQCHWHTPQFLKDFMPDGMARALKLEHCLVSNQWALQLQDTYALLKGPLSAVLAAPDQAADALSALRGADAPAFAFADSFHESVKFFGDTYFVANGYQNLAHAPWFGIAFAMGWKLGLLQSLNKTSGLINPLVDALASLARTNPAILPVAIAAATYGYTQQGFSGCVSGAVMGGIGGWGVQNAAEFLQKIPELDMLKKSGVLQSITPSSKAVTKAQKLIEQGCPEGLALALEQLLEQSTSESSAVHAFPETRQHVLSLTIGGEPTRSILDKNSHASFLSGLRSFNYVLECMPEKAGIEDGDERYLATLKNSLGTVITALEDYASEDELQKSGMEGAMPKILQKHINILIGGELRHFGVSQIHSALTGNTLSEGQKNQLMLQANRLARELKRNGAQKEDSTIILNFCKTMGASLRNIAYQPLLVPLSIGYKAGVIGKTGLKMALRETWYRTLQTLSHSAQGINKISPSTKGNLIGGGLTLAAVSTGIDFSPAAQMALSDFPAITEAAQHVSSLSGHAAGASAATGLFAIYNFAEDHLIIHVGLGFAFIVTAAGIRMVVDPARKAVKTFVTPALDMLEDKAKLPVRLPAKAIGKALGAAKAYGESIRHYDELFLSPA